MEQQALRLLHLHQSQKQSSQQESTPEPQESLPQAPRELTEEEKMLQKALEMSRREYQQKLQDLDEEVEKLIAFAKQESLKTLEKSSVEDTQKVPEQKDSDKLPSVVNDSKPSTEIPLAKRASGGVESSKSELSGEEAAQMWLQSARQEAKDSAASNVTTVSFATCTVILTSK